MSATWTITVRPNAGRETFRLTAISPDRKRVLKLDKLTAETVEAFDPELHWRAG